MTGSRATSASIQPPNAVGLGAQRADEPDWLDGATSPVPMAIATQRHSVGDNSSNFFSAASYTLTWSIGNSALRFLALFCRFKRWKYRLHPAIDFQAKALGHHNVGTWDVAGLRLVRHRHGFFHR